MHYLSTHSFLFLLALTMAGSQLYSQTPDLLYQNLKGRVIDKDTQQPIGSAMIRVGDSTSRLVTLSDENGYFLIKDIPVGRQLVYCEFVGYQPFVNDQLILNSVKEGNLTIALSENTSFETGPVMIQAKVFPIAPINSFMVGSSRSIDVNETNNAGVVNDPNRLAMGFPGVQGNGDNVNELIIRGNSPAGMTYRLEGVDIPNPNHFVNNSSSGGGITIFSAQLLGPSDFSTGAFPAEYGNSLAGLFDMHFRKGNDEQHEFRFKLGMLGIDLAAEGPFSKKGKSSFLANYRYSTLGILNELGFRLVGERVDNRFQDLSFNLTFPGKNEKSTITVFGLGGLSQENFLPVEDVEKWQSYDDYRTEDNTTNMGAAGVTFTHLLNSQSFLKVVIAGMSSYASFREDTLNAQMQAATVKDALYSDQRLSTAIYYNRKFSTRTYMKAGLLGSMLFYKYHQSELNRFKWQYDLIRMADGESWLLQPFVQFRHRLSEALTVNAGLHVLGIGLTNSFALDPRASLKLQPAADWSLSLAYGMHSMMVPMASYFVLDALSSHTPYPNLGLDPIRAHHLVLGGEKLFGRSMRLGIELYYQSLFQMPVSPSDTATYWLLNDYNSYAERQLVSQGSGKNMGVDLTLEKSFRGGFSFLLNTSLFQSTYETLEKKERNTRYNTGISASLTAGKEFKLGKRKTLETSLRVLFRGGQYYTPGDPTASMIAREYIPNEALAYTEQLPEYLRIDFRVAYRVNRPKAAYLFSLDVQNAANRDNVRDQIYDTTQEELVFRYFGGLIPVISFQIDFGGKGKSEKN